MTQRKRTPAAGPDWTSMTKEEHDAVMQTRCRPVTDKPVRRRTPRDEPAPVVDIAYLLAEQARRSGL